MDDTVGNMTQAELQRFIINVLRGDPAALPTPPPQPVNPAKQIDKQGAITGESLVWDGHKWDPSQIGSAGIIDGSVTAANVATGIFLQLASTGTARKAVFGLSTITWPGGSAFSNATTITHGLGVTPQLVLMTFSQSSLLTNYPLQQVFTVGATTFNLGFQAVSEVPSSSATAGAYWLAIG